MKRLCFCAALAVSALTITLQALERPGVDAGQVDRVRDERGREVRIHGERTSHGNREIQRDRIGNLRQVVIIHSKVSKR